MQQQKTRHEAITKKTPLKLINTNTTTNGLLLNATAVYFSFPIAVALSAKALVRFARNYLDKKMLKDIKSLKKEQEFESFDDVPKLKKKLSTEENFKRSSSGATKENSVLRIAAMCLREKGYDVQAMKTDNIFQADDFFKATFDTYSYNPPYHVDSRHKLMKYLKNEGEGAYGQLSVKWREGGYHSLFWKVENNKTRLFDPETGEEYTKSESKMRALSKK